MMKVIGYWRNKRLDECAPTESTLTQEFFLCVPCAEQEYDAYLYPCFTVQPDMPEAAEPCSQCGTVLREAA